jgi:hypothetical protein
MPILHFDLTNGYWVTTYLHISDQAGHNQVNDPATTKALINASGKYFA